MDRRDFFKILSTSSAGALAGCGSKSDKLIPMLVPEHEIVPGEEQWLPAVCTECGAGCGTLVRVMEGVREIERNGEKLLQRIAAVKKIEGNPQDPVSGGRLCARGQATVQSLYHPDRLRGPMKRTGDRGKAQFGPATWDESLAAAADQIAKARAADPGKIVFLTGTPSASRAAAVTRFLETLGAPPPVVCSLADFPVERRAAEVAFGWHGLPVYDLAHARYALGVGADFLGAWASPVYYARQFGNFRQGRRDVRGHLVQAESRMSITAAAADRWLPLRPGSEPQFLAAVGRILLDKKLARQEVPAPVRSVFESADARALLASCGLDEKRVSEVVQELGESEAPLVLGGASVVHSNSLDAIVASHYVNMMLGNVGKPGGILAPAEGATSGAGNHRASEALATASVILIDGANPAYTMPRSSGVLDALSRAASVISFSRFLDDSAAWSDLILPDHDPIESQIVSVQPLYDTRAFEKTLADITKKMGVTAQGGEAAAKPAVAAPVPSLTLTDAALDGDAAQYPHTLQPYLSLQFHDGSGSHLPWLQELPDPASSSIWGLPVEIDPRTAASLHVANGDVVRVESRHGSFEAPAYVHPAAVPGVASMAIGDGHSHYGRYASGRGANPLAILAPVFEKTTGALALGATRVRLSRVGGRRDWIQFAAPDREERGHDYR
jgi:anaerobic selenocysteine-containing dehydrogenase